MHTAAECKVVKSLGTEAMRTTGTPCPTPSRRVKRDSGWGRRAPLWRHFQVSRGPLSRDVFKALIQRALSPRRKACGQLFRSRHVPSTRALHFSCASQATLHAFARAESFDTVSGSYCYCDNGR